MTKKKTKKVKKTIRTDVTLIVDRSGSMQDIKEKSEKGIRDFVADQRKEDPKNTTLSIVQFNHNVETVCSGINVTHMPEFVLMPDGFTALLDAIGTTIENTKTRIAGMEEKPDLVVMVVVTDGLENASKKFLRENIRVMLEECQSKLNWKFTFLGANQDSFLIGQELGLNRNSVANYSGAKSDIAYQNVSSALNTMRYSCSIGEPVNDCAMEYSDDARASME